MDRGMKKFNAFKALTEHEEEIEKLHEDRKRVSKPVLDDEELNIINDNLAYALENKYPVKVTYYDLGFIKEISGNLKVDLAYQLVIIDKRPIKFTNVIKVEVIECY